ncbi:hypothetical protein OG21DRAFT_1206728 [Imleria badia]|nr:hypothetical protein OG21DRAFT_1206728 [Imleria badia]
MILTIFAVDEHQKNNVYKHVSIVVVGPFTQLGSLAAWSTAVLSTNELESTRLVSVALGLSVIGSLFVIFTGPSVKMFRAKAVTLGWLSCASVLYCSILAFYVEDISKNGGDLVSTIGLVCSGISALWFIGLLIFLPFRL